MSCACSAPHGFLFCFKCLGGARKNEQFDRDTSSFAAGVIEKHGAPVTVVRRTLGEVLEEKNYNAREAYGVNEMRLRHFLNRSECNRCIR